MGWWGVWPALCLVLLPFGFALVFWLLLSFCVCVCMCVYVCVCVCVCVLFDCFLLSRTVVHPLIPSALISPHLQTGLVPALMAAFHSLDVIVGLDVDREVSRDGGGGGQCMVEPSPAWHANAVGALVLLVAVPHLVPPTAAPRLLLTPTTPPPVLAPSSPHSSLLCAPQSFDKYKVKAQLVRMLYVLVSLPTHVPALAKAHDTLLNEFITSLLQSYLFALDSTLTKLTQVCGVWCVVCGVWCVVCGVVCGVSCMC